MSQRDDQDKNLIIQRLVIVSNRLPIVITKSHRGEWQVKPGSGGLANALAPILRDRGGILVGWDGTLEELDLDGLVVVGERSIPYMIKTIKLTPEEVNQFYFGFSNEIVWPLFHDLHSRCDFDPAYWSMYQAVNRKFAGVIAESVSTYDYIWAQDYHLMLVAQELRRLGVENNVGFFLHTPFPAPDIFMKLPWRSQILGALSEYDLVGFQTQRDKNNFIHCAQALIKGLHVDARRQVSVVTMPQREFRVGAFPISIDFKECARQAALKSVTRRARQLREGVHGRQIILGVDRLDYSKGIPERLRAFGNALERFDDLHGKVSLVQIAVPSREDIPQYQELKAEIESLVGEINGQFTQTGWIPIHYMYRSLERTELLAYYRAADIALVTPLKDGMNLVSKEYCAANIDNQGVLILSEFAGAATQLRRNALMVNPHDIEGIANAIHRACNMSARERQLGMRRLRQSVARRDIFWWTDSFLRAATAQKADEVAF